MRLRLSRSGAGPSTHKHAALHRKKKANRYCVTECDCRGEKKRKPRKRRWYRKQLAQ